MLFKLAADIALSVLTEWIKLEDLVKFDTSLCNSTDRFDMINLFRGPNFVHSGAHDSRDGDNILAWIYKKKIKMDVLSIPVYHRSPPQDDIFHFYLRRFGAKIRSFVVHYGSLTMSVVDDLVHHCKQLRSFELKSGELMIAHQQVPYEIQESCGFLNLDTIILRDTSVHINLFNVLFKNCPTVTELCVDLTRILQKRNPVVQASTTQIRDALSGFNNITTLDIESAYITDTIDCNFLCVDLAVRNSATLTHLTINDLQDLTDATVISIAAQCKNITILHMAECYNISDAAVEAVVMSCVSLTVLDVRCCSSLRDDSVLHIAYNPNIISQLDLSENKITSTALFTLLTRCTQLNVLLCDDCKSLGEDNPLYSAVLTSNRQNLMRTLSFKRCSNINSSFINLLAKAVPSCQSLNLSYCTALATKPIVALIKQYGPELKSLALDGMSYITDPAVTAIVKSCSQEHLQDVSLNFCTKIKCDAVVKITRVFPNCEVKQEKVGRMRYHNRFF